MFLLFSSQGRDILQCLQMQFGDICLWAEKVQNTIVSDLFHWPTFSSFSRRCMLFLTCILKFTLCYITVCLFDALTFSDFAEYYTRRCAMQTCTWSMPLLTSTAVFRSPFFHEMLLSDCPWTAAFIRSAQRGILWHGGWKAGSCHHRVYVNVVPLALGW